MSTNILSSYSSNSRKTNDICNSNWTFTDGKIINESMVSDFVRNLFTSHDDLHYGRKIEGVTGDLTLKSIFYTIDRLVKSTFGQDIPCPDKDTDLSSLSQAIKTDGEEEYTNSDLKSFFAQDTTQLRSFLEGIYEDDFESMYTSSNCQRMVNENGDVKISCDPEGRETVKLQYNRNNCNGALVDGYMLPLAASGNSEGGSTEIENHETESNCGVGYKNCMAPAQEADSDYFISSWDSSDLCFSDEGTLKQNEEINFKRFISCNNDENPVLTCESGDIYNINCSQNEDGTETPVVGNTDCWGTGTEFTADRCCDLNRGDSGDITCWTDGYTYEKCCTDQGEDTTVGAQNKVCNRPTTGIQNYGDSLPQTAEFTSAGVYIPLSSNPPTLSCISGDGSPIIRCPGETGSAYTVEGCDSNAELLPSLIESGILSQSPAASPQDLQVLGSLLTSTTRITTESNSGIEDIKNAMSALVGILIANFYAVESDIDATGREEALNIIGYTASEMAQEEEEVDQKAMEDKVFIDAGLRSLKVIGERVTTSLINLPGSISSKFSDIATLQTSINTYLDGDDDITLDFLKSEIEEEVNPGLVITDEDMLTIGKNIISSAVGGLGDVSELTSDIPNIVMAISNTNLTDILGNLGGALNSRALNSGREPEPVLALHSGALNSGGESGSPCGNSTAPSNQSDYSFPQGYDWESLMFTDTQLTSPTLSTELMCSNDSTGSGTISCNTSSSPNVIELSGCETTVEPEDTKQCSKPTTGIQNYGDSLPQTANFGNDGRYIPLETNPPSLSCKTGGGSPILRCEGVSGSSYTATGCPETEPTEGTCGATYGVDSDGKTGTDKCAEKYNFSGFWNFLGWNYDTDYSLPNAVYNSESGTKSCSSDCQDMTKYEGVEECCDLDISNEDACDNYRNLANVDANRCNLDNLGDCPEDWPTSWAKNTYWNDYLWVSANCDGKVVGDDS